MSNSCSSVGGRLHNVSWTGHNSKHVMTYGFFGFLLWLGSFESIQCVHLIRTISSPRLLKPIHGYADGAICSIIERNSSNQPLLNSLFQQQYQQFWSCVYLYDFFTMANIWPGHLLLPCTHGIHCPSLLFRMKSSHIFVVCSALFAICASSPVPDVATTTVAAVTTTTAKAGKPADIVPGAAAINPNTATSKEEIPEPKALPQTGKTVPAQLAEKIEAPATTVAPTTEQPKQVNDPFTE